MASTNFINECKNYANCNRLGELKVRDDLTIGDLEGNTTQETTTGKNLLKPNALTSGTTNGISYSYDEATQTYTFNGTCTSDNTTIRVGDNEVTITTNTYLSVHYVGGSVTNYARFQFGNSGWSKISYVDFTNISSSSPIKSAKSQASEDFVGVNGRNVRFNNGSVATNLKVKFMVANSTDTTYEPYTNGASPNPDYPQDVNVVTGRNEIDIVGKNLLEVKRESYTSNGITTTYNSNTGLLHSSGTTTTSWPWIVDTTLTAPIPSGTTLTFSTRNALDYGVSLRLYYTNNDREEMGISAGSFSNKKTVTHDIIKIAILLNRGANVEVNEDFYLQLEKGNTKTDFEPYKKQSYEINLGKNLLDKNNVVLGKRIGNNGYEYDDTNYYASPYIRVEPNTTYTKNSPTADAYHRFAFYTTNNVSGYITVSSSNSAKTPNNCHYIRMCGLQTELDTTQVEKGSQATSYSEYFTPIELCKITTNQDKICYQSSSNNLFDQNTFIPNMINNASKVYDSSTGVLTMTNSSTDTYMPTIYNNANYKEGINIDVEPNTDYTFSFDIDQPLSTMKNGVMGLNANNQYSYITNLSQVNVISFNTGDYTKIAIRLGSTASIGTVTHFKNFQLEKGSQVTEYQPYGNCWFIKKEVGKTVFDGSVGSWTKQTNGGLIRYSSPRILDAINLSSRTAIYSNYFHHITSGDVVGGGFVYQRTFYAYPNQDITTSTDFNTWLSTHNTIVYYILATPTYIKITNEALINQLEALMNAKGQFGNTTLSVTSSNLPITVDNTITEGLTLNQENYIQEFTIDSGCYVDGEIIGTVYSKKLETKLIDSKTIDLQNKEFISKVGVVYNNNTNEYEELGKFTVESPKEEQTDNASSFVAYDDLINHIDDRYVTELDYDDEGNSITLSDVYEELCRHLELTPVTTTFTNSNIPVNSNPFTNGEKNRDVLKSIEKVSCSYAKIDKWNNTIDLVWLSDTLDYTFTLDDYASLEGGKTIYGPINTLIIRNSEIEEENVSISDQESIEEYGEHQLVIAEDYFLYDAALREAAIQAIWNKVHNLTYVDCKLKTYTGKPFLDIGNKIRVYTDENNYFDTYVLKHEFKFNGAFESVIESPALTEQEIKTKQDITLQEKLRNTQIIVNKQEGTITGLVSKTNEMDVTVNNNYQDLNNKFDGYTPLSRTVNIENSVTTLQTDTYTKTQIDTKLTDGSVTKVMTTSGTFDIDGMHYEKTNAPTSTTINEVGVGVKKTSDTDYVLFAGYVDDNNTQYTAFKGQTIVASENMLVENYFVVGSKSRMEDYEDGTGVFYIGG